MNSKKVNAEEWIRKAVEGLDMLLFMGDLDLATHPFQVSWGRCRGSKVTECIQPSDNEDITLADFFPTTICVSFTQKSTTELLGNLALECIHAFFNEPKSSTKRFKQLAAKYMFDKPFNKFHPTPHLMEVLEEVNKNLIDTYGEFPNKPIVFPDKKNDGEKKKNTYTLFCPSCGMELKASMKMLKKHGMGLPTCACGSKFAVDLEDENKENENDAE